MYQDLATAFETLSKPVQGEDLRPSAQTISGLYQTANTNLVRAVRIADNGAATFDTAQVQQVLASVAPPNSDATIARVVAGLSSGFAMQGGMPVVPWSFFTDLANVSMLDENAWRVFGFGMNVDPDVAQFRKFPNVPASVLAPQNLEALKAEAVHPFTYTSGRIQHRLLALSAIGSRLPTDSIGTATQALGGDGAQQGGGAGQGGAGAPQPNQTQSDIDRVVSCLTSASWRMEWCGIVVCLGSDCAQAIQSILNKSTGTLIAGALAGVMAFIAKGIAAGIAAALAAWGGWVTAGILVSAAYWAVMIALNVTPRGICLHIPGPWTFGLLGPGWAVGR